jgi:hypothetical protein
LGFETLKYNAVAGKWVAENQKILAFAMSSVAWPNFLWMFVCIWVRILISSLYQRI